MFSRKNISSVGDIEPGTLTNSGFDRRDNNETCVSLTPLGPSLVST